MTRAQRAADSGREDGVRSTTVHRSDLRARRPLSDKQLLLVAQRAAQKAAREAAKAKRIEEQPRAFH